MIVKLTTENLYQEKILPWQYVYDTFGVGINTKSWYEPNVSRNKSNIECWEFINDEDALLFVMKYARLVISIIH
jgi:hypothetical protein